MIKVIFCCIDCGNKIDRRTALKGKCRCWNCHILYNKGENHPNYIHGESTKEHFCIDCDKKLSKYYSKRCGSCNIKNLYLIKKLNRTGKNSNFYIHGQGYNRYSLEFLKIREKIRQRDNFTCQNCQITEEEHLIIRGTVLNIHHIDYDKQNLEETNLITLCYKCNLKANFNKDYWFAFCTYKMSLLCQN